MTKSESSSKRLAKESAPVHRREYLKYLGAVGSTTASGTAIGTTADEGSTTNDDENGSTPEPPQAPTELTVDYETAPTNLRPDATPRFSWRVQNNDRNRSQSAYQVRVASDADTVNETAIWDSERVESTQSTTIEYAGPPLNPDETYYWKVRIWDDYGQSSEWSDAAMFSTARPVDPDQWSGTWIGRDTGDGGGLAGTNWTDYTFKTTFTIETAAAGFVFRATDANNCYMWQVVLSSSPDADGDKHVLRPHVRENGAWTRLGNVSINEVLAGSEHNQHTFRIEAVGDTFTTYIDDTRVDERSDTTHSKGTIGFRQYNTENALFDNVQVTANGNILFTESFSDPVVTSFQQGAISDDALKLSGTGIVLHNNEAPDPSPLLRTEFTANKRVSKARAHVAGIGYGEFYLNGERIGDEQLTPSWTVYQDRVAYSTYDVTNHIRRGENAAGIWLGKGWFSKDTPSFMNWSSHGPPRALVELDVTYSDGTTKTITTDNSWMTAPSPILENDVYDGETYDARRERDGWATSGFDDSSWEDVDELPAPGDDYILQPQRTQPIEIADEIEPVSVKPHDGGYVIDFGQNHAGWVEIKIRGASTGDEIVLKHAEVRDENGDLVMEDLRGADGTDRYVARGDNVETYEPRFTYHGYRYLEVRGYPGELTADDVTAKFVHTNKPKTGSFACSNDELNQVQHNAIWGMQSNSHSIPTDCCQRDERLGWTGDGHMAARSELFNFDAARFTEKWMRDHDDDQTPNGASSDTIPSAVSDTDSDPNWAKTRVTVAWYLYWHTGDETVLAERYDGMKAYVDYWHENAEDYIVPASYQHYGDWLAFEDTPDSALLNTWAYYQFTHLFARAAEELDKTDDAEAYHARADAIADAFNDAFLDVKNAVYGSGSQTTYALPLFEGIVPDEHEQRVAANLAAKVRNEDNGKLQTGFIGTRPLLFSLVEYGHEELAYEVVSQPNQPGWVYMVRNGATTMWERWDSDERIGSGMNSFNHRPWTEVSEWFYRILAGIDTAAPGYEEIEIDPMLVDDLDWAEASVDTVRGEVASRWERTQRGISLNVTVPWNATATVHVPARYLESITVDGVPIQELASVTFDRSTDDTVVLTVGSGEYTFMVDPVRGGAGFAHHVAGDGRETVDGLLESGAVSENQANYLHTKLQKLEDQTQHALTARSEHDRNRTLKSVQHALSTANDLADWVTSQHDSRRLSKATAETLYELTEDAMLALSYASSNALDASASASLAEATIVAGGDGMATIELENDGSVLLNDVQTNLGTPNGWTLSPTSSTTAGVIRPGETFTATYAVDVPVSQARGTVVIDGSAAYRYRGGTASIPVSIVANVGSPITISDFSAPAVEAGSSTTLTTTLVNTANEAVSGTLSLDLPDGWTADTASKHYRAPAGSETIVEFTVNAPANATHGVQVHTTATYGENHADSAVTGIYLGPAEAWEFETSGDTEGWQPWNDITDFTIADGMLSFRSTGNDPYMGQTNSLSIPAPNGLAVEVRMRTSESSGGQLFFTTEDSPHWSEGKSTKFDVTGGEWRTYSIPVSPQDSPVTGLRLDPVRKQAEMEVEYIRVYY